MRALWSGSLSFGLINIPVKVFTGSRDRALKFRMLDKETHSPISYQKVRKSDGQEVDQEDIVKGYEYEKGKYVILEDKDFEYASAKKSGTIDIVLFSDEEDIEPKFYEKPYYLEPDPKAAKAYNLLRDTLKKSKKIGIAVFVMREQEHVCAIKVDGKTLQLIQLRFEDELVDPKNITIPAAKYTAAEERMAMSLIKQETCPFKPADFEDTYTDELLKVIKKKAKGKTIRIKREAPSEDTDMSDILSALKKSLELEAK